MEKVTVDTILDNLQAWVENRQPVAAAEWLDAAQKLIVLVGDVQEDLFMLEQQLANERLRHIENGDSVAKAKAKIEATAFYSDSRRLIAKIDRVKELIRISKLQARMSDDNLTNNR